MLSSIIYSESGNQVYAGKKAVGIVVMNRVKSSLFPNTVSGVVNLLLQEMVLLADHYHYTTVEV